MVKNNYLKEKLKTGKAVIGTWCNIPSVITTDIIAGSGLDFLIIDSEHGPINFETAQNMVIACESRDISPVMRVSGINESEILKALDIGSHCVQVPNVCDKAGIEEIVKMAKYPPVGNRGFSPFTRAGDYAGKSAKELSKTSNENTMIAVHIEGIEAVNNIDKILSVKELDILFVGLFDLSKSLGIAGDVENPKVTKLLKTIARKTINAGKYTGSIVTNSEQMKRSLDFGVKYITYSVDCEVLKQGYLQIAQSFRGLNHD